MKVYNKKGLIWGIFWLILGVSALVLDLFVNPADFLPQTIKDVIIDLIIVLMGLWGFLRAFSAKATREDRIEENDERNILVNLKSRARTNDIMFWVYVAFVIVGGVAFARTGNEGWAFVCVVPLLLITVWFVVSIGTIIHYERRE